MSASSGNTTKIIQIQVEYERAVKALGQIKTEMEMIKKEQKSLKDAFKDGSISAGQFGKQMANLDQRNKALSSGYRTLTKTVQEQIRAEKAQEGSLVQLRSKMSILNAEFDKLSRKEREEAKGAHLQKKISLLAAEINKAEQATQRFYRNVGNYKSALAGLNKINYGFKMLNSVISPLLGGFGVYRMFSNYMDVVKNFEDAIARVRAVSNATYYEMKALSEKAQELGLTTKYTATQVAEGMEILARTGFTANQSLLAIEPTLHLAQANVISIAEAAQISTNVMHMFGMEVKDLARINDVLSSTASHSATNVSQMAEAMKNAGPIAHTVGLSLEETSAMIGALANAGMYASDAGTGIKQLVTAMTNAFTKKKGSEVLKKYGLEIDEVRIKTEGLIPVLKEIKESGLGDNLADMTTLVGKYPVGRLATLVDSVDNMVSLKRTLNDAFGENDRMFAQSMGQTSTALAMLKSSWEGAMIKISESTQDGIIRPINIATDAVRFFAEHAGSISQALLAIFGSLTITPLFAKLRSTYLAVGAAIVMDTQERVAKVTALEQSQVLEVEKCAVEEARAYEIAELKRQELAMVTAEKLRVLSNQRLATSMTEVQARQELEEAYVARELMLEKDLATAEQNLREKVVASQNAADQKRALSQKRMGLDRKTYIATMEAEQEAYSAQVLMYANRNAQIQAALDHEVAEVRIIESKRVLLNEQLNNATTVADRQRITAELMALDAERSEHLTRISRMEAIMRHNTDMQNVASAKAANAQIEVDTAKSVSKISVLFSNLGKVARTVGGTIKAAFSTVWPMLLVTAILEVIMNFNKIKDVILGINTQLREANERIEESVGGIPSVQELDGLMKRYKELDMIGKRMREEEEEFAAVKERIVQSLSAETIADEAILKAVDAKLVKLKGEESQQMKNQALVKNQISILEGIKTQYDKILESQEWQSTKQNRLNDLKNTAKNIVGEELLNQLDLNKAVATQIELLKQRARVEAGADIYKETQKDLLKFYKEHKIVPDKKKPITDRSNLKNLSKGWASIWGGIGGDYEDALEMIETMEYFQDDYNEVAKNQVIADINKRIEETRKGVGKPTPGYTPKKTGNGNGVNAGSLDELARKYEDLLAKLITENTTDKFTQQLKKINDDYNKYVRKETGELQVDLDKVEQTLKRAKKSKKLSSTDRANLQEKAEIIKSDIQKIRNELLTKRSHEIYDLQNEYLVKSYDRWISLYDEKLKAITIRTMDDFNLRLRREWLAFDKEQNKAYQDYMKGTNGLKTKYQGSPGEIEAGYKEYVGKRETIESSSDDAATKKERIKALDAEYAAEAELYNKLAAMRARKDHEVRLQWQEFYDNQNKALAREINNEVEMTKLKYEMLLNQQTGYYKKSEFGSEEYWKRVTARIGKQNAEELQLEWAVANQKLMTEMTVQRGAEEQQADYDRRRQEAQDRFQQQTGESNWNYYQRLLEQGFAYYARENESLEEYQARMIEAFKAREEVHKNTNEAMSKMDSARYLEVKSITGGIIQLLEAAGQTDKDMARAAKIVALAQIAFETGVAISKAVSANAGIPVAGEVMMAEQIGVILANIGSAISIINSAKFAKGGKVTGPGSGTSDSIPARLSNGEFVMTAKATKLFEPLLATMNAIGNGVALPKNLSVVSPTQMNDLKEAFIEAGQQITPVVSVQEITATQNRVQTIQNLDNF